MKFFARRLCVSNTYFKYRSFISTQKWQGVKVEHDRSSAGEEGYAAIFAECEGEKLVGVWSKRREVVDGARSIIN